ncbi:MAG: hypothetical protein QGG98_07610 [Pseudomonadales bacterium]|nr:hypothetical protein [Pseudomonadales bacterium]
MTLEQKRSLYRDGLVILKQAVPDDMIEAALRCIHDAKKGEYVGPRREITDLVNASSITPILNEAMGQFDPPTNCQVAITKISKPGDNFVPLGYRDRDVPYFGASIHMDGSITIASPQEVQDGTPEEIYLRHIASGPRGDLGRSPEVTGHNMGVLFQDPEMTLSLGSFTAFAFVALNDQSVEGSGQTAVIPGAHHAMEEFFRWQYETNGHLGPEGPGWPRLNYEAPNRCGMNYIPDKVWNAFVDESSESTADGKRWPRPTQAIMSAGDACITVFNIPHSATRNENGTESRKNIIFRVRNKKRQPNIVADNSGVTDHPDRAFNGGWLEFEEGNNPWERSKLAMCNMWDEWDGMQDVVAEERATHVDV